MTETPCWPWMKGVTTLNKDASNDKDPRLVVRDLVTENKDKLEELKGKLQAHELYQPSKHDDLWLLRFLLSHKGKVDKAFQAATGTLAFRHKYKLDEQDIRAYPPQLVFDSKTTASDNYQYPAAFRRFFKVVVQGNNSGPSSDDDDKSDMNFDVKTESDTGSDFQSAASSSIPETTIQDNGALTLMVPHTGQHGTLFFFDISKMDTHALQHVADDDWLEGMIYINEFSFQWLDYLTRTSGRLTKAVHIVNVANISWRQFNYKTQSKYTKAAQVLQDCYPQAVAHYWVCHAPRWISKPWRLMKPLLPKRVVSKLDFISPSSDKNDKTKLLDQVPAASLPTHLGGTHDKWPMEWEFPEFAKHK